ncbi:DEAF1 factor, partial [Polypterus senegalus]|nr:DEAF1 factor [Polypterus senegalus]
MEKISEIIQMKTAILQLQQQTLEIQTVLVRLREIFEKLFLQQSEAQAPDEIPDLSTRAAEDTGASGNSEQLQDFGSHQGSSQDPCSQLGDSVPLQDPRASLSATTLQVTCTPAQPQADGGSAQPQGNNASLQAADLEKGEKRKEKTDDTLTSTHEGLPSILSKGLWLFPGEFEILSGCKKSKHWKKSIYVDMEELKKSDKKTAVHSCLSCRASYCELHIQAHRESEALRRHVLVEPYEELQEKPVANTQAASQKRNHSGKQKQTSSSRPKKHLKQNEQDFTSESESWSTTHDYFSFSSPGSLEDLDLAVNSSHSGHPTRKKPDVLDSSSHAVKSKPQKPVKKNPGGSKKLSQSEVYDLISSRNELPIICKGKTGVLHKDKLATKGEPSIYFQGGWLFPGEFEILSGNAAAKHWKKSICLNVMELNKQFKALLSDSSACFPRITLFTLIEENKLKCELQEVRKELLEVQSHLNLICFLKLSVTSDSIAGTSSFTLAQCTAASPRNTPGSFNIRTSERAAWQCGPCVSPAALSDRTARGCVTSRQTKSELTFVISLAGTFDARFPECRRLISLKRTLRNVYPLLSTADTLIAV